MSLITEPLIFNPTDDEIKANTVSIEEIDESIITISVKIIGAKNQTISLGVDPSFTIQNVKKMINNWCAVSIQDQNIIFKGKVLQNDKTLQYYNITDKSMLKMDPLADVLLQNNFYNELYAILTNNNVDLETLQNDLKQNEMDDFCSTLNFNVLQKMKFRNLMRILNPNQHEQQLQYDKQTNNCEYKELELIVKKLEKQMQSIQQNTKKESKVNIKYDNELTIVLIGDMGVGKTSLMNRYVDNRFDINVKSTIGTAPKCHYETLSNETVTKITIWDTAGQERFHSLWKSYYQKADVILLCYDVNCEEKFKNFQKWKHDIDDFCKDDVIVIFVSCKGDFLKNNLDEEKEIMDQDNWETFTTVYCQCSAKTGDNVRNVFRTGAELMLRKSQNKNSSNKNGNEEKNIDMDQVHNVVAPPKKGRSCCVVL